MEAIPTIVCDTLYAMGLHDQTPSWKIMDNKGRITVVLHWEREGAEFQAISGPSRQSSTSTIASGGPRLLGVRSLSHILSFDNIPCLHERYSTFAALSWSLVHLTLMEWGRGIGGMAK